MKQWTRASGPGELQKATSASAKQSNFPKGLSYANVPPTFISTLDKYPFMVLLASWPSGPCEKKLCLLHLYQSGLVKKIGACQELGTEKAPRGTAEKVTHEAAPPPGLGPRATVGSQEVSGSSKELQPRAQRRGHGHAAQCGRRGV